ncbi:MAG: hypothetical protein K0R90_800 [Oscillospiraceae bacterium]|nr:hypothetical protein [Oscillospiraceae bacterium]
MILREEIKCFLHHDIDEPFFVEMTGISYCDGSYCIERKKSDLYVFEYILKGTGKIIVGSKEYTASEGDIYIIHKDSNHKYFSDDKNPWTKVFFNVKGELVTNLLRAYELENRVVIENCNLCSLFMDFYHISKSENDIDKIKKLCALKLHEIIQEIYENNKTAPEIPSEALALKQYLDNNVEKTITIEELSSIIYRSKDYTIKLFKKEFGQTPYTYLIHKKMEVAKYLLKSTTLSIKQIAFNLDYDDQHYFSNIFKKVIGVSPKKYRENHHKFLSRP